MSIWKCLMLMIHYANSCQQQQVYPAFNLLTSKQGMEPFGNIVPESVRPMMRAEMQNVRQQAETYSSLDLLKI